MTQLYSAIKKVPVIGAIASGLIKLWRRLRVQKRYREYRWYRDSKAVLAKNIELKGEMAGKRCFILSAGPSIKDQNLDGLENEFCISISNFFVHPAFKKIKPSYHLFPASHTPITDEQYTAWFVEAEKNFPAGQRVLVSVRDKYLVDRANLFKNQRVYYYLSTEFGFSEFRRTIDFTRLLPIIQTTVQWAIYLALYAGAPEIYLLGCDHNWVLGGIDTSAGKNSLASKHFYDNKDYVLARKGYISEPPNTEEQFKSYLKLWRGYRYIKKYAEKHGVAIKNATPGSLLDVFPKKDLEEILQ